MLYGDLKYLARRTSSDKVFRKKAFSIPTNPKYGGCQRGFDFMVYKFFDKKISGNGIKNEIKENLQLAKELANEFHKSIIKRFKKRKIYPSFRDNI